jgi:hypothetical protein
MTPKEHAEELVDKFIQYTPADSEFEYPYAKECALIAVDEILKVLSKYGTKEYEYWEEVKNELQKI